MSTGAFEAGPGRVADSFIMLLLHSELLDIWLTMLSREIPTAPEKLAFRKTEPEILDGMVKIRHS